jgi:hypothetical protein
MIFDVFRQVAVLGEKANRRKLNTVVFAAWVALPKTECGRGRGVTVAHAR